MISGRFPGSQLTIRSISGDYTDKIETYSGTELCLQELRMSCKYDDSGQRAEGSKVAVYKIYLNLYTYVLVHLFSESEETRHHARVPN